MKHETPDLRLTNLNEHKCMTAGYGSSEKPKEIFGNNTPEHLAFQDACVTVAPEAFKLMGTLINAWQKNALEHSWYMPDAFSVKIKVLESQEKTIQIDELDGTAVTVYVTENKPSDRGVSLVANVTHSIDAYVLRTMQRRCAYNTKQVHKAVSIIKAQLEARKAPIGDLPEKLAEYIALHHATKLVDVVMINVIDERTVNHVPVTLLTKLLTILEDMLTHPRFDLLTVHDEFKAHPNHCNRVRYWYKEILAELADSTILDCIYTQITGRNVKFRKAVAGISKLIREAEYQLS